MQESGSGEGLEVGCGEGKSSNVACHPFSVISVDLEISAAAETDSPAAIAVQS